MDFTVNLYHLLHYYYSISTEAFIISVLATMNERFRHCISMTKMLNSENLLADSGLDPSTTAVTADRILYNYAMEQCQSAALDELFGNPGECFQVK